MEDADARDALFGQRRTEMVVAGTLIVGGAVALGYGAASLSSTAEPKRF